MSMITEGATTLGRVVTLLRPCAALLSSFGLEGLPLLPTAGTATGATPVPEGFLLTAVAAEGAPPETLGFSTSTRRGLTCANDDPSATFGTSASCRPRGPGGCG